MDGFCLPDDEEARSPRGSVYRPRYEEFPQKCPSFSSACHEERDLVSEDSLAVITYTYQAGKSENVRAEVGFGPT